MKLLIRGGSIAAGYGVNKGYVDILQNLLRDKGIDVINRSRYRETSFEGIETFQEDIGRFRPDILVVHFGVDDAFEYVYRSEFQENIVQLMRLARLRFHPEIFLATAHTFDNPYDMEAVHIFYKSLRIVASDLECGLIPVHHYWAGYLEEHHLCSRDLVLQDCRYPNEHGHRVIAETILKWLEQHLNSFIINH
ncbi:MAG: SGNH/GDSL hydrolase family protein [Smithella sp.]|nr:SGNH/GDSL hydrolase family protein [Smithella sp.]MDM7987181.1 SGNH/GDSL hydrolase family protein [Smithella sp.]HOU51300.1 SGNH/GDSL hydrolase family protein [Smithella sp.]HQI73225.1 SGNH/GDSL hydrolase family protein [Smithella sp.]